MMNRAITGSVVSACMLILGAACVLVMLPVCSKKSTEPLPPPSSGAPVVDSLSSESGWPGDTLGLFGSGFGADPGSTRRVTIGDSIAAIQTWSNEFVVALIPHCPGIAGVSFVCGTDTSIALAFQVNGILGVRLGLSGSSDTAFISGLGFGDEQDSSVVELGGQVADVAYWSDTLIAAVLPSGMNSSSVKIVIGTHTDMWEGFEFRITPLIIWIEPKFATYGTEITIWGERFLMESPIDKSVFIGDVEAPWNEWSDTTVAAVVPHGCVSGDVRVCRDRHYWSNGITLEVFGITSVEPDNPRQQDTVAVVGSGFGSSQGSSRVLLKDDFMPVVSWSDTTIRFRVPTYASSGQLLVLVAGMLSNSVELTVRSPDLPVIDSIEPTLCTFGTQFTIWGRNFHSDRSYGCLLYIGETGARWIEWDDSMIVGIVPDGCVSGDVRVRRDWEYWSNGTPMRIFGITSIAPRSAWFGDTVIIAGTGFGESQGASAVLLDGMPMPVLSWSNDQITISVPEGHASGLLSIEIDGTLSNSVDLWIVDDYGFSDYLNMTNSIWVELKAKALYTDGRTGTIDLKFRAVAGDSGLFGELAGDSLSFSSSAGSIPSQWALSKAIEVSGKVDTVSRTLVGTQCYCWWAFNDCWMPGAPHCSGYEHEYRFTITGLSFAEMAITEDTLAIRFEASGLSVAGFVQDLHIYHWFWGSTSLPEGDHYSRRIYFEEVLWDDPGVIPHLSVTFEQR